MSLVAALQNVKWRKEEEVRWTDIAKLSSPKLWSYLSSHKSRTKKVWMNATGTRHFEISYMGGGKNYMHPEEITDSICEELLCGDEDTPQMVPQNIKQTIGEMQTFLEKAHQADQLL